MNPTVKVCVLKLSGNDTLFSFFKEMNLSKVPAIGDKIIIDNEDACARAYKVVDVQFADLGKTDVFVLDEGELAGYLSTLGSMHAEK